MEDIHQPSDPEWVKVIVEQVQVPDAQERLRRGYERILRAAARDEEEAGEAATEECPDGEAKPDVSRDGGRS